MPFTTCAMVREAGTGFELVEAWIDDPKADDVLVRIEAAGMCHADLAARDGDFPVPLPAVLGHEGAGTVVATGPAAEGVQPGDRVVITFDSCGRCSRCRAGLPSQCARFLPLNFTGGRARLHVGTSPVHNGFFGQASFSQLALANAGNVVPVKTELPWSSLAPLGCGVATGFGAATTVLRPSPGDAVAIFGLGAVGLSALMALTLCPIGTLIAVDVHASRLALAAELGATQTIDASVGDVAEVIRAATGSGVAGAIECSGDTTALTQAIAATATGGTTVIVGAPPFGRTADLDVADLVNGSKRVVGSATGASLPRERIPTLVRLVESGRLPVSRLVTEFALADINAAAAAMRSGAAIKPVLLTR